MDSDNPAGFNCIWLISQLAAICSGVFSLSVCKFRSVLKDVQSFFFLKDYEDYRLHKVEIHINFMLSTAAIKETWLSKGEGELSILLSIGNLW